MHGYPANWLIVCGFPVITILSLFILAVLVSLWNSDIVFIGLQAAPD